jgi:sensor c-di-GMP phosphodiesterase-like protein
MCVVAEGIETVEQLIVLAALGCDFGQGFLIAHPMTSEELIARYVAREEPFAAEEGEGEGDVVALDVEEESATS